MQESPAGKNYVNEQLNEAWLTSTISVSGEGGGRMRLRQDDFSPFFTILLDQAFNSPHGNGQHHFEIPGMFFVAQAERSIR